MSSWLFDEMSAEDAADIAAPSETPDDDDDVSGAGNESALVEFATSCLTFGLPRCAAAAVRADRADAAPPLNVAACNRLRLSTGTPVVSAEVKKRL